MINQYKQVEVTVTLSGATGSATFDLSPWGNTAKLLFARALTYSGQGAGCSIAITDKMTGRAIVTALVGNTNGTNFTLDANPYAANGVVVSVSSGAAGSVTVVLVLQF